MIGVEWKKTPGVKNAEEATPEPAWIGTAGSTESDNSERTAVSIAPKNPTSTPVIDRIAFLVH